MSILSVEIIFR